MISCYDYYFLDGYEYAKSLIRDHNEFTIQPNPTSRTFLLDFKQPTTGELKIIDNLGSIVKTFTLEDQLSKSFDISMLNNGLFYVSFTNSENYITVKKLIKIE